MCLALMGSSCAVCHGSIYLSDEAVCGCSIWPDYIMEREHVGGLVRFCYFLVVFCSNSVLVLVGVWWSFGFFAWGVGGFFLIVIFFKLNKTWIYTSELSFLCN